MTDQTWLITGTSSGFGKELATIIAQRAHTNLIATARHLNDLNYLDSFDHGQIMKAIVDVTNLEQIQAMVTAAKSKFAHVDVLVNNAGLGYFSTIEEGNEDDVRQLFDVNFFGLVNVTKAVLPLMRAQRSGTVANISSVLGLTSLPTLGYYSASKYAVEGLSEALRQEIADLGIDVMLIEPSGARTNWAGRSGKHVIPTLSDYRQFEDMITGTRDGAGHEPGNPQKIAAAIVDAIIHGKPRRLPLGDYATHGAEAQLTQELEQVLSVRDISLQADDSGERD
ncbi:SDR family NAD(P)-dependent oxidoreductase [Agrilactobacillus yilanensis]|uniref:SDR family NAD(P)-dependent oxidoreductase n=1 Tax=Agrilactobacillus yilanensis TaxID=2485997 RepID=A0ABW4J8U4_9LACO|nr:SDR family NAD(P)-dependent oxidoreductase [Agrilactobacillus yilanensis]